MSTASLSTSNPSASSGSASSGSASALTRPGKTQKNKSRRASFFWITVGLLGLLLYLSLFCRTTGKEFSPVTFQTRDFYLYRIPGTNIQLLPNFVGNAKSMDLAPEILGNLKTLSQPLLWHPLESNALGGDSFPASLLTSAITRRDSEWDFYWGIWSQKHTARAAILWPMIQSMAMADLYHDIPETLRFAEGFQGADGEFPSALIAEIHRLMQQRKALYESSSGRPTGKSAQIEGIPEWSDVQRWLDANPLLGPSQEKL